MTAELRPLALADVGLVQPLAARAFDDLAVRQGRPPQPSSPEIAAHYRRQHEHLLATGRGVGAFAGDELVGVALSYERGPVWVLALLVVAPGRQSAGTGTALLHAALQGAPRQRLLHSSRDPRAMRGYARAGFRLLPSLRASGRPAVAGTRARDADLERDVPAPWAAFAGDLRHVTAHDGRVLVPDDGRPGLAVVQCAPHTAQVAVLSAQDQDAARALLHAGLGVAAARDVDVEVVAIAPQEHWAVDVVLEAGLELAPSGPVAVAGVEDPLRSPCAPNAELI